MAPTKLARIDTSPALEILEGDAATLTGATAPLQNVENGALPPTPLSADIKTNMTYNVYNAQRQRELEEYKAIFNQNMKNKPVKHDKAHVFIWTWEEKYDDLKVKKEVDALQKVFEDQYSFEVERQEINFSRKSGHQLKSYLTSFMHKHDDENTLLIFYYAGHGVYHNSTLMLTGTNAQQTEIERLNNIAWSSAEGIIKAQNADILVIFDCCSAGGFGGFNISGRTPPRPPPFQCLAACGSEEKTPEPGPTSFTSALIWALKHLGKQHPFTSNNLLAKVKEYKDLPKTQTPMLLKRDQFNDGLVWIAPLNAKYEASKSSGERRDPLHEHMDIRLHFYRCIKKNDVKDVAKILSKLIHEDPHFQVKHVDLIGKSNIVAHVVNRLYSGMEERKRKRSTSNSTLALSPTATRPRRKHSYPEDPEAAQGELVDRDMMPSPLKRLKTAETMASLPDTPPAPESVWYHFRMALHCSLQNVKLGIGSVAERIRPGATHLPDPPIEP